MPEIPADLHARFQLARELARSAGQLTLTYFCRPDLEVERKSDASPVTVADREAETHIRAAVAERFPDDGIVGEEHGTANGSSPYRWIVDPIDGTKSFIHGVPLYGTMVAVEQEGRGVIGVVEIPALGERVYAVRGGGAWHETANQPARAARVSQVTSLSESLFLTSQVDSFQRRGAGPTYQRLEQAARLSRTWGDCYGYLLVATGRAQLMVDPEMSVWDAAALQPIMEEAGGSFTDWQGEATIHAGEGIGACTPEVLREALAIIRSSE